MTRLDEPPSVTSVTLSALDFQASLNYCACEFHKEWTTRTRELGVNSMVKLKKQAVRLVPALSLVAVVVTAAASSKWG